MDLAPGTLVCCYRAACLRKASFGSGEAHSLLSTELKAPRDGPVAAMDGPDVPPPKEEVKTESHDSAAEAPTLKFEGSDAGETLTELLANGLASDGAGSDGVAGLTDGNLLVNALHENFDRASPRAAVEVRHA